VDDPPGPTASTLSVPSVGIASISGSNSARSEPAGTFAARNSVGGDGEPLGLGGLPAQALHHGAASKLSCATRRDLAAQSLGAHHRRDIRR
jgi:hypothetical protein